MDLKLNDNIIENVEIEAIAKVSASMKEDLIEGILYGSCARGDYSEDSDIDIALITRCDRISAKKYNAMLSEVATELAMKYFAIVNFVCIPYEEYIEKKGWYSYFENIAKEGVAIYG
ncbi:MAG: nucleotidyltransferase domain-containing protein [Lachnospira sp.]